MKSPIMGIDFLAKQDSVGIRNLFFFFRSSGDLGGCRFHLWHLTRSHARCQPRPPRPPWSDGGGGVIHPGSPCNFFREGHHLGCGFQCTLMPAQGQWWESDGMVTSLQLFVYAIYMALKIRWLLPKQSQVVSDHIRVGAKKPSEFPKMAIYR